MPEWRITYSSSRALNRAFTGTGIAPRRIAPTCSANASRDAFISSPTRSPLRMPAPWRRRAISSVASENSR